MSKSFRNFAVFSLLIVFLTQCQAPIENNWTPPITEKTPLRTLQERAMIEILTLAKKDDFRKFILKECLKQKHGDYNVFIQDIINSYNEIDGYKESMQRLQTIVDFIKPLADNREPLIFYPRAETIEDKIGQSESAARISEVELQEPLGVFQVPDDVNYLRINQEPPIDQQDAYRVNSGNGWVWVQYVTEDYAWENDVWVIGNDEGVELNGNLRTDGGAEYGGFIQITNLNAVEHWTSGKLELHIVVASSKGAEVSNKKFDKVKRKHFRDNQWYDYNHFLGYWNKANLGDYEIENWIERDGGGSSSASIAIPSSNGGPGYTYTFNLGDRDDNLGKAMVQFTDPISTIYPISYMNFKRK